MPNCALTRVAPNRRKAQGTVTTIRVFISVSFSEIWLLAGSARLRRPCLTDQGGRMVLADPPEVQNGGDERQERKEDETHSRRKQEFQNLHFRSLLRNRWESCGRHTPVAADRSR